jgi:hypothetical protein
MATIGLAKAFGPDPDIVRSLNWNFAPVAYLFASLSITINNLKGGRFDGTRS